MSRCECEFPVPTRGESCGTCLLPLPARHYVPAQDPWCEPEPPEA